jgi:ParB family chromosome partitioning protein
MAGKFNLGELIAQGRVSKLDTGADVSNLDTERDVSNLDTRQIESIDIDQIDDDPANFYALTDLDALAENIELLGLQQPLLVRPNPEAPDRVIIISGHRRRAAIRKLVEDGREDLRKIPCIRETGEGSAALQELRLIYANSDTRKLSDAEISKQAERVEALLYQLREEGYRFPGRMRDHVAEACKVSAPKLARLKVIRENLCYFQEDFERGALPEQTAYALARLPGDFQRRIYGAANPMKHLTGNTMETIQRMYAQGARWEPTCQCPDGKPCTHGDAALRHDLEDPFDPCGGKHCCLECYQATRDWSPCELMCAKAKAARKSRQAEKDAEEKTRLHSVERKSQKATQANARRLLPAIEASGLEDDAVIKWERYRETTCPAEIRRFANGNFDSATSWTDERLAPDKLEYAAETARQLDCSTDFLLGLIDTPRPVVASADHDQTPQFTDGSQTPPRSGPYYCRIDYGNTILRQVAWWDGGEQVWRARQTGPEVRENCLGWYPLPEDKEEEQR